MKNNYLKGGLFALMMIAGIAMQAQTTATTDAGLSNGAGDGVSVKLIDNKGTIKYLQTNNGITSITSTNSGSATTTTWQLGGTLNSDTNITTGDNEFKITLDSGDEFVLDGVVQETGSASTATTIATSGWTILVRDETTGEVRKLLASDLVSGIRMEHVQVLDASANVAITVLGLPVLTAGTTLAKLYVYRNGAKLRSGTDFTATADTVTITYSATDLPSIDFTMA